VFGRRSAVQAAGDIKGVKLSDPGPGSPARLALEAEKKRLQSLLDRPKGLRSGPVRQEMAEAMVKGVGVFRDQSGMETASAKVADTRRKFGQVSVDDKGKVFNTDLVFALELDFMIDCAEAICASALARKESRGAHYRTDIKERDDKNWLKHILALKTPEGAKITTSPVTITKWEPVKRAY
jgi:succinate dehydrogenase / fumarate reductase flavoprotein subunit